MSDRSQLRLTLLAVVGLAHWFFGNLYEAVVISPNWVVDAPAQLQRLHEFFVTTSPTLYFAVVTHAAPVLVWALTLLNTDEEVARDYRRASVLALLSILLNTYIVTMLIGPLFGADYRQHADQLSAYAWRWNIMNGVRMGMVAATIVCVFDAFRKLDRKSSWLGPGGSLA